MVTAPLPRLLVIDDLYGRAVSNGPNTERDDFCSQFGLIDATEVVDESVQSDRERSAVAEAVFWRGQIPKMARLGDEVANDLAGTLEFVSRGWGNAFARGTPPWALILLDMCFYTGSVTLQSQRLGSGMPEGRASDDVPSKYFGLALLSELHSAFPELPIIVFSSMPRKDISLEFSRRGALGFIARDDGNGPALFRDALEQHGLLPDYGHGIVGNSLPLLLALREARRSSKHRRHVLIKGERGTGKELLADFLHRCQSRGRTGNSSPYVAVNAAVLRNDLLASELFGIEARTASGVEGKVGLVESANGGDLFLDEIADLPGEAQATLLRTLEDGQVLRVGGRVPRSVDVRVVAATNADLEAPNSGFRKDLLDRLRSGGTLALPPLRERRTDIPALVTKFVRDAEAVLDAMPREVSADAMTMIVAFDWPGNIRELRNCVFDAVSRHTDVEHLVPAHLRFGAIREIAVSDPKAPLSLDDTDSTQSKGQRAIGMASSHLGSVDRVVFAADSADFVRDQIESWCGRYPEMQLSLARMQSRYLHAALLATCRRTAERPEGVVQIHPAVKLLTGDTSMTASMAADFIKRILVPLQHELHPPLSEALDTALRLRPRAGRKPVK